MEQEGIQIAIKYSSGKDVYTYKTTLKDIMVGEIVAVPQKDKYSMAAVVAVDNTPVPFVGYSPVITLRECDIDPALITPKMRTEYKYLIKRMKEPDFFNVGIAAEPRDTDKYAVSVRFMGNDGNFSEQEYMYLTDDTTFQMGDIVIVPAGPFNLPKRASVVRYTQFPKENGIKLKRVCSRPLAFALKKIAE